MSELVAPGRPRYTPHRCYAPAYPGDTRTHCMKAARLYPVGWRCDIHKPASTRTTTTQEGSTR